jgi:hypothetical protein
MSLITFNISSSAAAVTLPAISRTSLPQRLLCHLPSNPPSIFVLPSGRISPLSTHAFRLHYSSSIPCPTLAELNRKLPLRLQCPSPTSDLQYLTSPRRLRSTFPPSSLLDTAILARKATQSAWESQTPTSSSLRDLGGDTDLPCLPRPTQTLILSSTYIAPTHIAFAADDRTQVRNCYTSALSAGGRASGAPSYRNNECSCFNAAVEDLDGNTIEFIFRENGPCHEEPAHADEEHSRVLTWQDGVSREAANASPQDDAVSVASKKSKATTAVDIAPSAKEPSVAGTEAPTVAASAPASGGVGSFMSALSSGITPKAMLGGVIGAVATGAVAYAFYQAEQDSARAEAEHEARMAAYERGRAPSTREPAYAPAMKRSLSAAPARTAYVHRNFSTTESIAPPPRQHRNFSVTESRVGPRPPPTRVPTQAPTALRAIEARAFDHDSEIQTMMSKHTSRRPVDDDEIQTVLSRHTSRHGYLLKDRDDDAQTVLSKQTSRRPVDEDEIQTVLSKHTSRHPGYLLEDRDDEAETVMSKQTSRHPGYLLKDNDDETQTVMSKHTSRHPGHLLNEQRAVDAAESEFQRAVNKHRPQELRGIDADSEIQAATSRSTTRRPQASRSQTFAYAPASSASRSTRGLPQRSVTLADEPATQLYLEGPKDVVPSSSSLRSGRDGESAAGRSRVDGGASAVSRRSERREILNGEADKRSEVSTPSTVRLLKSSASRVEGSRHEGSSHGSRHEGSRHEGSSHSGSRHDAVSRSGTTRDPDALSDASTIKASRRDSAAQFPSPGSKANSKVSRMSAAEYRLPDSPVPSYYYPPTEPPKPATRAQSQVSAMRVPIPASRAPSHVSTAHPPVGSPRRGSQVSAAYSPSASGRRSSHHSGSAAGIPLPSSSASGRAYEDVDDSDGLADTKTVVPDDSISCIDLSRPKAPRSDHSKHSERSHRSHRTHHSSRSKHSHRHEGEQTDEPLDTQTVVPDDSISSVGYKTARSEMSHRSEHKSEHKSHHGSSSRVSKHSKSHDHDKEKEDAIPLDARTVLPEDSISSVGAPARSEHSHRSEREHKSEHKSHHGSSSRVSRHSRSHDHKEKEDKIPLDAQTILPEDSISSVGAPARSEHSHRGDDDRKSHHSSRSKHSSKSHHRDDKEKKDRTPSEAGKSDVTVKPAKSMFSAITLPGRLRGGDKKDEEKKKKRSVASYA